MKTQHFEFELLTRCFLGGSRNQEAAELRASSIRGQLRWWFRVLGGFTALAPKYPGIRGLQGQENLVFGMAAGTSGTAGLLRLQIAHAGTAVTQVFAREDVEKAPNEGYFLWPFAQEREGHPNPRACLVAGTKFQLRVHWRGDPALWPSILALVCVFGHLGSLGTRGRRAMGALYLASAPLDVATAQQIFSKPDAIMLRRIDVNGPDFSALVAEANTLIAGENNRRRDQNCREGESKPLLPNLNLTVLTTAEQTVQALALWLKHHRAYKLMPTQLNDAPTNTSFRFAKRDHDRGADSILRNGGRQDVTYRSAVGLPIIQRFHGGGTVKWEKNSSDPKGRFASPVLLRPCRDMTGKWHALVIFVEARKWPDDPATHRPREVYLNNQPRSVSLDLYNAMKTDPRLTPYPGLPEFPWDCRDRG